MQAHNQTRMQRKDYSRVENFIADEKQVLYPCLLKILKKYYKKPKSAHNNPIYLSNTNTYYVCLLLHIGKQPGVIYTRKYAYRIFGDKWKPYRACTPEA